MTHCGKWSVLNPLLSDCTSYPLGFVLLQKPAPTCSLQQCLAFPSLLTSLLFLFWGPFPFPVIGAGLLGGNHLCDWGDLESVTEGMLSESGTLGDYDNPKLITAGLVQQEIWDILDTVTSQEHQGAPECVGEGWLYSLFAQRGTKSDPFPLRSWLGRKEMRMSKGRWKAQEHCSLWAHGWEGEHVHSQLTFPCCDKTPSRAAPRGHGSVTNITPKAVNRCPQPWACCPGE